MRIYLAGDVVTREAGWSREVEGWRPGALASVVKRRLFSYYYHGFRQNNKLTDEMRFSHECGTELFLDSGAYTALEQGAVIPVERYAAFINQHGALFSVVANLDVIGDAAKSWDNLKALESLGCAVIPVFHQDEEIQYLKTMLDAGYPFIALGGLVGSTREKLQPWLDAMWGEYLTHADGTPKLRVHGFGLTDFELMRRYPWFSLDSTTWMLTASYGACALYRNGKLFNVLFSAVNSASYNIRSMHFQSMDPLEQAIINQLLKPHGVTAQQCAEHYSFRLLVNARTYQQLEGCGVSVFRK